MIMHWIVIFVIDPTYINALVFLRNDLERCIGSANFRNPIVSLDLAA